MALCDLDAVLGLPHVLSEGEQLRSFVLAQQ